MSDPQPDPEELARLLEMRVWYVQVFSRACGRIRAGVEAGEGILLDAEETAVVADVMRCMALRQLGPGE